MSLPIVWLPEADAELKHALARYDGISPELAQRFAAAASDTIDRIADGPLNYAVVDKGLRRAGVHRFPYGLFFLIEETRILIVACFHGRRSPSHWQSR